VCSSLKDNVISAAGAAQQLVPLKAVSMCSLEAAVVVWSDDGVIDVSHSCFHFELLGSGEKLQRLYIL